MDIGYSTNNFLLNLGAVAFFFIMYIAKLAIFLMIGTLRECCINRLRKIKNKLKRQIFFTELLIIMIDPYIEFLIASLLSLMSTNKPMNGEIVSDYVGYVSFVLSFVILPLTLLVILVTLANKNRK